ncbi:MAG TPA: NAD-dependent epimerase/dehydratase family protein [Gemmatimonadaceae bacterium]|nr:NAD-dependent epimerase/dehydratase family protein [Gemmatimonadaceae bacterium]
MLRSTMQTNVKQVLVTGGSGFIGRAIVKRLQMEPLFSPRASCRRDVSDVSPGVETVRLSDASSGDDIREAMGGCSAVVHTAGLAHRPRRTPLSDFRRVNVGWTRRLMEGAIAVGVERFVFLSSAGVYGKYSCPGVSFRLSDAPKPTEAYAISKLEAEERLWLMAAESGVAVTVIRPALVYGAEAPGNLRRLAALIRAGIPLPLARVANRRSFIALDSLVDLIVRCLVSSAATGRTFLASDGLDISTPQFVRAFAGVLGRRAILFPVPAAILELSMRAFGLGHAATQLCRSFQLDISETEEVLDWQPMSLPRAILGSEIAAGDNPGPS